MATLLPCLLVAPETTINGLLSADITHSFLRGPTLVSGSRQERRPRRRQAATETR
ncbi:hypothetical protein GCM10010149_51090 [Nonomuraea roseoviolacea subsp. roseoviolacea]